VWEDRYLKVRRDGRAGSPYISPHVHDLLGPRQALLAPEIQLLP
jgi:hypothetical protein